LSLPADPELPAGPERLRIWPEPYSAAAASENGPSGFSVNLMLWL
jgi:hypothetical protein